MVINRHAIPNLLTASRGLATLAIVALFLTALAAYALRVPKGPALLSSFVATPPTLFLGFYPLGYFGVGLPMQSDNGDNWPVMAPLLADPSIVPMSADIRWTRDAFRDLLRIRASSTLLRMRTADDIEQRLRFHNTGSAQEPTVLVAHLDGRGYPGANFRELVYLVNVDKRAHALPIAAEAEKGYRLHPVHRARDAADRRAAAARYDRGSGTFHVPARTAVVSVVP